MGMSRTERAAKGYIVNVLQTVVYMGLQALLAPLILKLAGVGTLGAYGAVMQVVAYYSILDFSLSMTLSRHLAQCHGREKDTARFRAIFTTGRTCLLFSGLASAVLAVAIAAPFVALLKLPAGVARDATYALYLMASWFILRTP